MHAKLINGGILILLVCGFSSNSLAALAPQHQNLNDLRVMVAFVSQHPRVASSLTSITIRPYQVRYGKNCIVNFVRQKRVRPSGWVGPAAPLVFKRSSCPIK